MCDRAIISVAQVCQLLRAARVSLSDEKVTQAQLAEVLVAALPDGAVVREHRLLARDIVDIFVDGRIAIEIKLKGHGRKMSVFRQLSRYAEHQSVTDIILATNLSMGLPATIEGKPAYFIDLGRQWL